MRLMKSSLYVLLLDFMEDISTLPVVYTLNPSPQTRLTFSSGWTPPERLPLIRS